MNVLEKILEEIDNRKSYHEEKTYQQDDYEIQKMYCDEELDWIANIIRSHMDEVEKEKVTSAEIISRKIDGKSYYEIKLKKVGEDEYNIGYSSFKLDYVIKWLNDYFEFCGEAKVSCENDGWIPVEERLPEETTGRYYPEMNVTTSYRVVTWGFYRVRDKQWYIYSKIHNEFVEAKDKEVIAWQPLPKPYKK